MTLEQWAPTCGLRVGGLLIIATGGIWGAVLAQESPPSGLAIAGIGLALASPAVRRRRSGRRRVAIVAAGWFVLGGLVVSAGWVLLGLFPFAFALVAASMVALTACGVGWGNEPAHDVEGCGPPVS